MPFPPAISPLGRVPGPAGLGLILPTFPQAGPPPTAASLARSCRQAEAAGAAGLWACDHLYWHGPSLECMTALAVASAATERCLIGSCVLQLPLRRPSAVAKAAASLQQLSSGRFVLGVGVGTHAGEYRAAGVDFHRRGQLLDAGLAELRAAWEEDATGGGGGDDRYRQLPVPAALPVWVGGSSAAALRRAADHDGWVPLFVSPEDYGRGLRAIRQGAERSGRDPATLSGAVVAFAALGTDHAQAGEAGVRWLSSLYGLPARAFARHLVAGDARAVAQQLARWVEHGAQHVVVFVTDDRPLAAFAELAGEFATVAGAPVPVGTGPASSPGAGTRALGSRP